jgi:DNA relaxase NicK
MDFYSESFRRSELDGIESEIRHLESFIERLNEEKSEYIASRGAAITSFTLAFFEDELKKAQGKLLSLKEKRHICLLNLNRDDSDRRRVEAGGDGRDAAHGGLTPHSNTGGIDDYPLVGTVGGVDLAGEFLFIRDKKQKDKIIKVPKPNMKASPKCAFIDWITIVLKITDFYKAYPDCKAISNDGFDLVMAVSAEIERCMGFGVTAKKERGMNFYSSAYELGNAWGNICIGGKSQKETICIIINGQGLMAAKRGWAERLKAFGESVQGCITRVDLAHDYFYGEYTVDKANADDDAGLFSLGARQPKVQQLGNWKRVDGSGRTLQIGARESGKLLRVYEKGKQLGGNYSDMFPDWTRVELELHSRDRVIPWDILIQVGRYLAGSYNALAFIDANQSRITTKKNTLKVTVDKAKAVIKNQFGRYLWALHEIFGDSGIHELFIAELPKRFVVPDWSTDSNPPVLTEPVLTESFVMAM